MSKTDEMTAAEYKEYRATGLLPKQMVKAKIDAAKSAPKSTDAFVEKMSNKYGPRKPKKYRNQPCEHEGEKFDSKLERDVWIALCFKYGRQYVKRQPSFKLAGGQRIRPDFLVILGALNTTYWLFDAKGHETPEWKRKAKQFAKEYFQEIVLINSAKDV